jgi:hypothetical protein
MIMVSMVSMLLVVAIVLLIVSGNDKEDASPGKSDQYYPHDKDSNGGKDYVHCLHSLYCMSFKMPWMQTTWTAVQTRQLHGDLAGSLVN